MGRRLVRLLNSVTRLRRSRCTPDELLVLLPSCLQSSECQQKITNDISECRRCGRCKVRDLVELCEKYSVRCAVATGGRLALELAEQKHVKAIVAIACEKELREGMTVGQIYDRGRAGFSCTPPHGSRVLSRLPAPAGRAPVIGPRL